MAAATGTFSYWRYGWPSTELRESEEAPPPSGLALEGVAGGVGELTGAFTVGGLALAGDSGGLGELTGSLTSGAIPLAGDAGGVAELTGTLTVGGIIGRSEGMAVRYGNLANYVNPRVGTTGTFSYWRYGTVTDFLVQAGPLAPDAPSGTGHRRGRFRFPILARFGF